jgi:hypothetical protein
VRVPSDALVGRAFVQKGIPLRTLNRYPLSPSKQTLHPTATANPFLDTFMTAIDRTAYPRPGARLTREELGARYTLTETDLDFVRGSTRGKWGA